MINLEKYCNEIKELGKSFGVIRLLNKPTKCSEMPCESCIFYDTMNDEKPCKESRLDWLFIDEDVLTTLKITQLCYSRGLSSDGKVDDCKNIGCDMCIFNSSNCNDKKLELFKKALKETY